MHLEETVGKDAGEGGRHATDEVKDSISLLEVVAGIPAAEEVGAAGEETSLEDTENKAERNHLSPVLDEAEADLQIVRLISSKGVGDVLLTIVTPHRRVIRGRKRRGPILRRTTVAGG